MSTTTTVVSADSIARTGRAAVTDCLQSTITFVFTDIEGSTQQWEHQPAMHTRVEQHFAALHTVVGEFGGRVFATMGDGVAAAFSSAQAAVHAAIESQQRLSELGLRVRMGVHTGEVERAGDDFRGRAVNRAARIMAVGHGGQVLLSDVTASIVRTGPTKIGLDDLGLHRLRGLTEPEHVWQVVHASLERRFPPLRGVSEGACNLPTPRTQLVGRGDDISTVLDLVRHHRLVTLTGVGGVGKTRLAIEAASMMTSMFECVRIVELADVAESADVAPAISRVLGAGGTPSSLTTLATLIGSEPTLLVIDNCEHVVEAAALAIDSMLSDSSALRVIATSREALGIDGEQVVAVQPLDPETSATELFSQRAESTGLRAGMIDPGDALQICRQLDGLPLAIELAAARVAALGTRAIIRSLDDCLSILQRGRPLAADRHGTMRTTIDWSYRLLDADEQQLFERLAVFANGFEIDAVVHVAQAIGLDCDEAIEALLSLVNKSMLAVHAHARGLRYRMLETMRTFALERLRERNEFAAASFAHADWVASLTDLAVSEPCTAQVERHSIRLEREADNWREAALLAARIRSSDLARRLCGPPTQFFLLGRHDLADVIRPLLGLCDDDPASRRSVLCALCVSVASGIDGDQLSRWADEVQQIDESEPTGLGSLMQWLASVWRGDFASAVDICVRAADDDRLAPTTRDMHLGIATLDHFSLTAATTDPHRLLDRALHVADRSDVALSRVSCLLGAGWGLAADDPARAVQLVHRAMAEIDRVPALARLTLPGSAARLLAGLDPRFAAEGLLAQLDAATGQPSFVRLIPISYASSLLHRVGHRAGEVAVATLTVSPLAPYLSMLDVVDLAHRTSAESTAVTIGELESMVRRGLDDIAAGRL